MTKTLVSYHDEPRLADVHAERAVLGAGLLYPATAPALASFLGLAAFTLAAHRSLFAAAQALLARSEPCDPLTVTRKLAADGCDGVPVEQAALLVHRVDSAAAVEPLALTYATIVHTLAVRARPAPEQMPPEPLRGFSSTRTAGKSRLLAPAPAHSFPALPGGKRPGPVGRLLPPGDALDRTVSGWQHRGIGLSNEMRASGAIR